MRPDPSGHAPGVLDLIPDFARGGGSGMHAPHTPATRGAGAAVSVSGGAGRAVASWDALIEASGRREGNALLISEPPFVQSAQTPVWPLSQVIAAAMSLADAGTVAFDIEVDRLLAGLERHRRGDAYTAHPRERLRYYDDNAWVGLGLAQWHTQRGRGRDLTAARRLFAFAAAGEHRDGGVHWREGTREPRNTCSTAPAAQLALRIHGLTGEPGLVEFAARADRFLSETLESPQGLMWDHVDADGTVERTVWSYNQGSTVSARVLLGRATGDARHVRSAQALANATLEHFGRDDGWWRQPAVFNAICLRNLVSAAAIAPEIGRDRIHATLADYLDRVWEEAREDETGLFVNGGIGRYDQSCIDQAGITQLYALSAWPRDRLHLVA